MKHLGSVMILLCSALACKTANNNSDTLADQKAEPKLVLDQNFEQVWPTAIVPFIENGKKSYFTGSKGAQLESVSIDNLAAKANVIAIHGFSQNFRSFSELMYNFWNNGYAVHSYSHVGHGCSEHLLLSQEENSKNRENQCQGLSTKRANKTYYSHPEYCKIHVDDRNRYIDDLKLFVDRVKQDGRKTYLYCHSMGGGICSRFIQEHPDAVDAVFLNAPMHTAKSDPFPPRIANLIVNTAARFKPEDYVPNAKELAIEDLVFEKADHTSRARFDAEKKNASVEAGRFRCGATNNQAKQLLAISSEVIRPDNLAKVKVPVVIAAGNTKLDRWVKLEAIETFCKGVETCRYHVHENSRHEIYSEPDAIRIPLMKDALAFFENPEGFLSSHPKKY